MKQRQVIVLCMQALKAFHGQLPESLYQEAHDLIKHNEYGLALEFVIDWIGELDLQISADQMQRIETAMTAMGLQTNDRVVWLRRYYETQPPTSPPQNQD